MITGATGMVGSLLARRAAEAGYAVRALVRSATPELESLGVEQVVGDLAVPHTLGPALAGVQLVVHSAAHVGDWGPAEKYRAINVFALEHMLTAVERGGSLQRWVQISSLGVYSPRDHVGTDETTPPDVNGLDGYTRTKAEAELVLQQHMRENRLPAVIVRPGFIYGPGDRHVLPRLIERISAGKMKLFGDGQKLLNNTYVGNLVDAIFLALEHPAALGETFNIRDARLVTRQEFVGAVADYLGQPRPGSVPLWLARPLSGLVEGVARAIGKTQAPVLTKARLKFLTLNLDFSIDKARRVLGYEPRVDFQDGIREALDWATGRAAAGAPAPSLKA
jgi:nucleoside-diphosphate-sugar epimerase